MADSKVFMLPDSFGGNAGFDPNLLYTSLLNNNGFGGNGGWMWFLFLFLIFGWGGNGFGNGFNNNGAAGFLSNQLSNDTGRELLMNAIQGNHEAVNSLASLLNTEVSTVQNGIFTLNNAITSVGTQVGMSGLQTINAIQSGNAALAKQLCECCCENRLLTTQQGYESRIQTIEQTNQLGSQADRNTNSIVGSINANGRATTDAIAALQTNITKEFCDIREREMQSKIDTQSDIITQLRGQLDNDRQTSQLYQVIAPLQAKVNEIANKQPNTVPVEWPNIQAVNVTPYFGQGFYGGYGYGNDFWS